MVTDNEIQTDPPKPDTNSFPKDDDAVLMRVNECEKQANDALGDWYEQAKIDFDFAEGRQWLEEDAEQMEDENRIPVIFNRVAAVVNAICGQEVSNRQEVKYLPRRVTQMGPPGPPGPNGQPSPPQPIPQAADPMNDAVKWAREQCNAEDEDSDAFRDQVICGMGWTVLRMDYEEVPEGMTEVIRRDPLTMRWDPSARRKNLADMSWVQCDYPMRKEDIESKWPDADIAGATTGSKPGDRLNPIDTTEAWKYQTNSAQGKQSRKDELRVTHHVERRKVKKYRAVDPATGKMQELSQSEMKQAQSNHKLLPPQMQAQQPLPQFVPVTQRMYWEAWTVGGTVLASGEAPAQKGFCYQAMTCYRERETGYWSGVVRYMRDPQRYANRLMSLMMSILGTGAKGGMIYETGAFVNPKKAKDDWARWDSAIEATPGALSAGKIQPKPPVQLPPGASDLMQFSIGSIRDVTGVNIEMLGQQNSNETGVVEDMKTKAGLTILASVFDAMRLYRKRQAVILAEYVQKFISDGRLIRVLGSSQQQFIPLIRDPDTVEYDIVVDESPSSRDVKERTWAALQMLVPLAMQSGMPLPPSLLDYTPLPQSLVMEWKQAIEQQKQQPPQPPLPIQIEQMKQQGEMQSIQAKAQADSQTKQAELQMEQQKLQMAAAAKQQDQQNALALQASNDQRDAQRTTMEFQLKREQSMLEMQMQERQHERDMELQIQLANIKAASTVEVAQVGAARDDGQALKQQEEKGAGYDMGALLKTLTDVMSAPKQIVRDQNGRAVGVQSVMPKPSTTVQ